MKNRLVVVAIATTTVLAMTSLRSYADTRAKLFPLSFERLPASWAAAPGALDHALARSLDAELATVPVEDAAELIECSLPQTSCLEAIAGSAGAPSIVFGRLDVTDDGAVIELTEYEVGHEPRTRTLELEGRTVDDLVDALRTTLRERDHHRSGSRSGWRGHARPRSKPARDPVSDPARSEQEPGGGHPTTATWAMIAGGGIAAGIGLAFVASANTLRAQAAAAPIDTHDELVQLAAIERAGRIRMGIGIGAIAVGGVTAAIGIARAVIQRRSGHDIPIDVVPEDGGASVRLTVGWR